MVRAMLSALRMAVPLNTRCSIRWDIPSRPSGSWRDPVSTQTPTATDRTWGIRSVMTRIPLGRTLLRYPSVTWRMGRVRVIQLFLVGQRGLIAQRHLPRQPHLAVVVDLDDLDQHLVALAEDILDGADARFGDLRNVEQALGIRDHLNERAELDDLLHLAEIDPVQLDLATDVLNDGERLLHRLVVGREDGHAPVVLHVDLGPRLLLDPPDDLAAGADDLADLLGADLDRDEPRSVGRQLRARFLDSLPHLGQHGETSVARLLERRAHDVDGDAGDLDVH